jgi:hypothetical protein
MRYVEARQIVLAALASEHTHVATGRESTEAVVLLATKGSVELRLAVSLSYARKRGRVCCSFSSFLWSRQLQTHPVDRAFLKELDSMRISAALKNEVIALRRRLNGRVPYAPESLAHLLNATFEIGDWNADQLSDRLVLSFAAGHDLAAVTLPARDAEGLLRWQRMQQRDGSSQAIDPSSGWHIAHEQFQ